VKTNVCKQFNHLFIDHFRSGFFARLHQIKTVHQITIRKTSISPTLIDIWVCNQAMLISAVFGIASACKLMGRQFESVQCAGWYF
jgi:hypothetical protein